MVPAAPLLPAIEADSAVVAQRDEPAVVLVAAPDVEVEVGLVVIVVADLPDDPGVAVEGGDDKLDEQALSRTPPTTTATAEATATAPALNDLLRIRNPRLLRVVRTPLDRTTPSV
jgi:hypothetical protein